MMTQITAREFAILCRSDPNLYAQTVAIPGSIEPEKIIALAERNGYQIIGWKDYLKEVAIRFQDGGSAADDKWFSDPVYRRAWHRQGIRDVPRSYAHNPR